MIRPYRCLFPKLTIIRDMADEPGLKTGDETLDTHYSIHGDPLDLSFFEQEIRTCLRADTKGRMITINDGIIMLTRISNCIHWENVSQRVLPGVFQLARKLADNTPKEAVLSRFLDDEVVRLAALKVMATLEPLPVDLVSALSDKNTVNWSISDRNLAGEILGHPYEVLSNILEEGAYIGEEVVYISLLKKLNPEDTTPILLELMEKEKIIAALAIREIGLMRYADANDALYGLFTGSPFPRVRQEALKALVWLKHRSSDDIAGFDDVSVDDLDLVDQKDVHNYMVHQLGSSDPKAVLAAMNYLHDEPLTNEASILEAALCHLERGEPKFVDPISAWLGENGSRKAIAILRQAAAGFGGVSTSGKNVQRAVEQIEHRLCLR